MNTTNAQEQHMRMRIGMAIAGVILSGVCVGIFQKANLGVDPFTCLVMGAANLFVSTYSTWYVIITGLLLIMIFFISRNYIGMATVINLFGVGFIADLTRGLLDIYISDPSIEVRLVIVALNVILASFAASLYFTANLGVSAYDAVALTGAYKYRLAAFRTCRVLTDFFCVLIGFALQVTVGIGTVITAFFMGPIVQWFNKHFSEPLLVRGKISL